MIRCIAFDFDGTLVHSNSIKREGMLSVASRHPGGREIMTEILAGPPGPRTTILPLFAARIGAEEQAAAMLEEYGRYCTEHILTCPARAGADAALAALRARGVKLYVNSATPTEPLREVIELRYGAGAFDGIYGGFGEKAVNLRTIMEAEGLSPGETAMVGDGIDDFEAAAETGAHFVGVAEGTLAKAKGGNGLLADLSGLVDLLQKV